MSTTKIPSESEVAVAAFHLWEAEGRPDGMAQDHWYRARTMLEARDAFGAAPAKAPRASRPRAARAAGPADATTAAPGKPRAPRKPKIG